MSVRVRVHVRMCVCCCWVTDDKDRGRAWLPSHSLTSLPLTVFNPSCAELEGKRDSFKKKMNDSLIYAMTLDEQI